MAAKKSCVNCGNAFIGRAGASYCSPTCRQRAHRGRKGDKCDKPVTDKAPSGKSERRSKTRTAPKVVASVDSIHSADAVVLLASLDAELAENSAASGDELGWSAAEVALRDLIACTVDRKVDLWAAYQSADDAHLQVKLSAELRLLETSLSRLLKQVRTELPASAPAPRTTQKASKAARVRWARDAAR